jgi:hypothetical protein
MGRTLLGILSATVAVYLWGFIYWGLNPLPYATWKKATDDRAAQSALREQFPEDGTYHVPSPALESSEQEALYQQGPVGFVHITAFSGRPMHDVGPMVNGFFLYLLVAASIHLLLNHLKSSLTTVSSQLKVASLIGLTAVLLIDLGDVVWWSLSLEWKLHLAVYHLLSWPIMTVVLCRFDPQDT